MKDHESGGDSGGRWVDALVRVVITVRLILLLICLAR